PRAALRLRIELGSFDQILDIARGEQIGLLQIIVVRVVAPFLRGEAAVARLGRRQGFARAGGERSPEARLLVEVALLKTRIAPRQRGGGGRRTGHDPHPALRDFVARAGNRRQQGVWGAGLHRRAILRRTTRTVNWFLRD